MKRPFDFTVALLGLLLLTPLMILIALCVGFSSPGAVLYSQLRVGRCGRLFRLYKFRTMVAGADALGSSITTRYDSRVTPVGKLLRRTKLDELPQLWNVVKGDMSLVGPRPDLPEIIDTYTPEMRRVLQIRPGITSIATLQLRDEEELLALAAKPEEAYLRWMVPAKVRLSMQHVDRKSFWFDLHVLSQTVWVLTIGHMWPAAEHSEITALKAAMRGRWPQH